MRFGKKHGFDFALHKDEKVGVLRNFVKSIKQKNKDQNSKNTVRNFDKTTTAFQLSLNSRIMKQLTELIKSMK